MNKIIPLLLVCIATGANAEVFKRVGPDGTVYFSDQPGADARPVEVAPAQTVTLPPVERTETPATAVQPAAPAYTAFRIVNPAHEAEIRANDGNVTVQLQLEPSLQAEHSIRFTVDGEDGELIKPTSGLSVPLTNLSRGRHTVAAAVVDAEGKALIRTEAVSFQVLRVALGGG